MYLPQRKKSKELMSEECNGYVGAQIGEAIV